MRNSSYSNSRENEFGREHLIEKLENVYVKAENGGIVLHRKMKMSKFAITFYYNTYVPETRAAKTVKLFPFS